MENGERSQKAKVKTKTFSKPYIASSTLNGYIIALSLVAVMPGLTRHLTLLE